MSLKLAPITALLAISRAEDISLLGPPQHVERERMIRLWNYLQSLKASQASMMAFLIDLPLLYVPSAKWGTFSILLKSIEEFILSLPPDDDSIPLFLPLAKHVSDLPRQFLSRQDEGELKNGAYDIDHAWQANYIPLPKQVPHGNDCQPNESATGFLCSARMGHASSHWPLAHL